MASLVIMVIRLHVMIMFFKCSDCQVLSTCVLPIYNQECDLNCTTADQSKVISFYKLPDALSPIGQCLGTNCLIINASLATIYSIQSTDSNTTTFRINNLSWDEKGTWRCEYDSTEDTKDLDFAKYPDDIEYSGLSNNSDIESGTVMPITMKCLYTEIPTLVTLIYQSTGGTARSIPVTCTDTTSSCANNNFVSKLCRPIIQVETGVVCDGNYSIAIATSVLGNEERKYSVLTGITIKCSISEMSTSIATERMTSIDSISELSNTTFPMISGSTTTTSIKTTNIDANTQTNEIQTNTLRIISNSVSTYQSLFVTTTATDISGSFEIPLQTIVETFTMTSYTKSSCNEIISPSTFETSIVFPQTVSETSISLLADTLSDSLIHTIIVSSGSLIATNSSEFSMLFMTISPSYVGDSNIPFLSTLFSVPSLTSDITDSAFEITNVSRVSSFSSTTETVITLIITAAVDSSSQNTVLNSEKKSLLSISENNSRIQQIETNTESSSMSTTFIDQISYSSMIDEPSFSFYQDLSKTSVTLLKISVSIQLSSSIIDTMDHFIYTTDTLITSYLDDTRHSFADFSVGFLTFSRDYAASASTSFIQTTVHYSSLQTTEYHATKQTEFASYVTTSFYESNTDNVATGIYSSDIATSGKSDMPTSVKPFKTQLASINDVQGSTTDFQSTYLESYSQSTNEVFSSEISEYLLSSLQSTGLLLQFVTQSKASGVESDMKTTSMSTFESQSGKIDLSIVTNTSSVIIPIVSSDFKTKWVTTTINFNSKTVPLMIKPSSQQTSSGNSYIEIDASFKDSLLSFKSEPGSRTSNYPVMTSLSSGILKSIRTLSPNTVQSGLDENNKNIIFITIMSAVLTIIFVILLIMFAKVYLLQNNTNPCKVEDDISWSNTSIPPKTAFPNDLFTGNIIYPLFNTSSGSLKKHPYEHNWNDIV